MDGKILVLLQLVLYCVVFTASRTQAADFKVTHQVYFDISVGDEPYGRIILGLFGDVVPKTVKNFYTIATKGVAGKTYKGSKFHRIIAKFMIQGGDIVKGDGSGSTSIYGNSFKDENFDLNHTGPGFLSMANSGKDTNGCQFFITTIATPWLDGKHTIFGKIVTGQNIVHKIEQIKTDADNQPLKPVIIKKSGSIKTRTPFYVSDNPYDLWGWIKASTVPLTMSFSIMGFFHWIIKKLDAAEASIEKATKEVKQE